MKCPKTTTKYRAIVPRSRLPTTAAYIDACRGNEAVRLIFLARAGNSAMASDQFIRHQILSPYCRLCESGEEETLTHLVLYCPAEAADELREGYRNLTKHIQGVEAYNPVEILLEH